MRPLRRRRGGIDALAILTIGVNIVLATELTRRVGTDILPTGAPWGSDTATFLGITVPQTRIAAAIVAIVLMGVFFAAFKYSDWGVAMRSTAADPETAALMGIRLSRVAAGAWAVSGVLAAIAGAFFTSFPASGVSTTTYLLALTAIPAAVLGGLDSIAGAVVGGLIIGVVDHVHGRLPGRAVVPRPRPERGHPVHRAAARPAVAAVRALRDAGDQPCLSASPTRWSGAVRWPARSSSCC